MALPESTERRLMDFINQQMYREDPYYHAMTATFRNWLISMRAAMEDEEVDAEVIELVLNRVVYGHPSPAIAYERIQVQKMQKEFLMSQPVNIPAGCITDNPS